MKLRDVLNKFSNEDFLLSVNGLCDEMPFEKYEEMKKEEYWKKYRDKKVVSMAILMTNDEPELCVDIEE